MGLSAVVYRNISKLPDELRSIVKLADADTGELEFVVQQPQDPEVLYAAHARIGNISLVAWIREQIASRWNDKLQTLQDRVLFNGTHSGDFIELDAASKIRSEIREIVLTRGRDPEELIDFFETVRRLLHASEVNQNPIVFQ